MMIDIETSKNITMTNVILLDTLLLGLAHAVLFSNELNNLMTHIR